MKPKFITSPKFIAIGPEDFEHVKANERHLLLLDKQLKEAREELTKLKGSYQEQSEEMARVLKEFAELKGFGGAKGDKS